MQSLGEKWSLFISEGERSRRSHSKHGGRNNGEVREENLWLGACCSDMILPCFIRS